LIAGFIRSAMCRHVRDDLKKRSLTEVT
jgi:hypothetical protein